MRDDRYVWMTEDEMRKLGQSRFGFWLMPLASVLGVIVFALIKHFLIR